MNTRHTLRRVRRRRRTAGFNLLELMITIALIAMLSTAVGLGLMAIFDRQKVKLATGETARIKAGALTYMIDNPGCPTIDELVEDGTLDRDQRNRDPWDGLYWIECQSGGRVIVRSAGPDGVRETEDDISTARDER